jgi:ATP-dependent Lhr-like helicase
MDDTLHEAMDVDGLVDVLARMESGEIATHFVDSTEPSLLAHEILNGAPYTFLDDAPLEERRSRAVHLRRGLPTAAEAGALSRLDPAAITRVREETAPDLRGPEELHDLLLSLVVCRPLPAWQDWFAHLVADGRAMTIAAHGLWCATERRRYAQALFPQATFDPDFRIAGDDREPDQEADAAAAAAIAGQLDIAGPVTAAELGARTALADTRVQVALARLEAQGFVLRGTFDETLDGEQWCSRRLLARIHAYTQNRRRREIQPVSAQEFAGFLLRWQHTTDQTRCHGRAGVLAVIDKLQGFELAAGAWEESVFPARVQSYQQRWLEEACLSGEVVWGRLALRAPTAADPGERRSASAPSRATPITFALREDLPWLMRAARGDALPEAPVHGAARELLDALGAGGAMFQSELRAATGRLPGEVEEGLWDLVARGLVTSDGFGAVRALFSSRESWQRAHRHPQRRRLGARRLTTAANTPEGRWALLPTTENQPGTPAGGDSVLDDADALAEQVAGQLLARWGVLFWDLTARENLALSWRELLWALRRLEARGLVRGGRFVAGFSGEQYALPEAVAMLRERRGQPFDRGTVHLSASDPLNLAGIVLPGPRVPALRRHSIVYRDGVLAADTDSSQGHAAGHAQLAGVGK